MLAAACRRAAIAVPGARTLCSVVDLHCRRELAAASLRLQPASGAAYRAAAAVEEEAGDDAAQQRLLHEALRCSDSDSSGLRRRLAKLEMKLGDYESAAGLIREARRLATAEDASCSEEERLALVRESAAVDVGLGNLQGALKALTQEGAAGAEPACTASLRTLAAAHIGLGQQAPGKEALRRAVELQASESASWLALAAATPDAEVAVLEEGIAAGGDENAALSVRRAQLLATASAWQQAVDAAASLRSSPTASTPPPEQSVLLAWAEAELSAGNVSAAVETFGRAVAAFPASQSAWLAWAGSLVKAGQPWAASRVSKRAAELLPDSVAVASMQVDIAVASAAPRRAMSHAQRALQLQGADDSCWLRLVRMQGQAGSTAAAAATIAKALRGSGARSEALWLARLRAAPPGGRSAVYAAATHGCPASVRLWADWAAHLLQAGRPHEAARVLQRGTQLCSGEERWRLFVDWSKMERARGDSSRATELASRAAALRDKASRTASTGFLARAKTAADGGHVSSARSLLERAVDSSTSTAARALALCQWGVFEASFARLDDARALLRRAVAADSRLVRAWTALIAVERRAEGSDAAAAALSDAKAACGDHPQLLCEAGQLAMAAGDAEAAEAEFRAALAVNPALSAAWQGVGRLAAARDDLPAAAQAYASGLSRKPRNMRLWVDAAAVEERRGDRDAAAALLEEAAALMPRNAALAAERARMLTKWGRTDEARAVAKRGIAASPRRCASCWSALAQLELADGQLPAAAEALRAGLEQAPGHHQMWAALGNVALRAGRSEEAIRALRRAARLRPAGNERVWTQLALAHMAGGSDAAAAVAATEKVIARGLRHFPRSGALLTTRLRLRVRAAHAGGKPTDSVQASVEEALAAAEAAKLSPWLQRELLTWKASWRELQGRGAEAKALRKEADQRLGSSGRSPARGKRAAGGSGAPRQRGSGGGGGDSATAAQTPSAPPN